MRSLRARALCLSAIALTVSVLASSCSTARRGQPATDVDVTLRDFRVGLSDTTVRSGPVSFDIRNLGPSTHEFVVIRTDLESAHLPIAADGLSVDEDSSLLQPVEEDPNLDIGDASVLEARLPPGHYVMFCNLEGHYLGGMHVGFSVR